VNELSVKNLVLAQVVSLSGHTTRFNLISFAEHSANKKG